ncbi:hypothetical protein K7432_000993 [Basidiobolus ranarum]|uniref:STAS domain-containing protein n=1 Tax=Basidiobolus ranarum TaxID=34480 RepID=A0ABR2WAB7_9FUNG
MANPRPSTPPGVVIFRFSESITFLNGEYFKNKVLNAAYLTTDPAEGSNRTWADKNWSDDRDARIQRIRDFFIPRLPLNAFPRKNEELDKPHGSDLNTHLIEEREIDEKKVKETRFPVLRAAVLDFSSVNHVDYAGLQWLLDLKAQLSDYAGNRSFELHFVGLKSNVLRRIEPSGITKHPDDGPEDDHRYLHLSIRDALNSVMEDWHRHPSYQPNIQAPQPPTNQRVELEETKIHIDQ